MGKKEFQKEWDECTRLKLFEIEVINNKTNETGYIIFNISIDGDYFVARRTALNFEEQASNKIAFSKIDIDYDFSVDENLACLYDACITDIIQGDFFSIPSFSI